MRALVPVSLAVAVVLMGCPANKPPLALADGCQPLLNGADCMLPYPSDFYRVVDDGGTHLAMTGAAVQVTPSGARVDVNRVTPNDAFSTVPTLVTMFPEEVVADGFVKLEQGGEPSLSPDTSNTLIVDADTNTPVAHFVDLDPRSKDPKKRAIVLHVFVGLKPLTRYVVMMKNVKNAEGNLVTTPEGFRRLRDSESAGDPQLEPLQKQFDAQVFPAAAALKIPRKSLQLAWTFTTGSDEWATRDMLKVRELTQAWLATHTTTFTVTSSEEMTTGDQYRVIQGHYTVPLFVESTIPAARLSRDPQGNVKQNDVADAKFMVVVPMGLKTGTTPGGVTFYGHGFFGDLSEVSGGGAAGIAVASNRSLIATEWVGMSSSDITPLAESLTSNGSKVMLFGDRVHQGMANWMVLTASLAKLATLPELLRNDGSALLGGTPNCYIGISQGHILGGTMTALNPQLDRIVFEVGGAAFVTMMSRASPFDGYLGLLSYSQPDPLEQQKFLATLQRQFDRFEPATYAKYMFKEKLAGNPDKKLLVQAGLCDHEVPNLGTFLHARLLGLPLMQPSPYAPWGLENVQSGATSALELYDFKVGNPDEVYRAADFQPENEVHEGVRRDARAKEQMSRFWNEGVITHICNGPCVKP